MGVNFKKSKYIAVIYGGKGVLGLFGFGKVY